MARPSVPRLFWLFARTAARRFCNRFLYGWGKRAEARRRKRGLPEPERTATAHRHQRFRPGNVLAILFSGYLMLIICMAMGLSFSRAMNGVRAARQPSLSESSGARPAPGPGADAKADNAKNAVRPDRAPRDSRTLLERMDEPTRRTAGKVAALMMLTAGLATLLFAVGVLSRQVSRPEPSLAWLFEFPVPRTVLFSSKLAECLFDSAALPMLSMLPGIYLFQSGYSFWASVGWGLAFGFLMSLAVSALRIATEVLLLQKFPRRRRGTITGICAAFGGLLMVVVLYGGGTPALLTFFLAAADRLPDWLFLNPLTSGFGTRLTGAAQWWCGAAITAGLCVLSVRCCARLTRFGLEPGLETARGQRTAPEVETPGRISSGLVGKELLMLGRQRTILVQVLLAPLIMVLMMYFQSDGRLTDRALGSDGALASAIFGLAAYMVLIASQVAMNTELRTLWLLLSLPRPLADSLRVKSLIWGTAAAGLALVLAVTAMILRQDLAWGLLQRLPFIVILVALIADLSVGIRTMGSSVISETTVHSRQWAAWLPLFLSAGAGQAVYAGDMWMLCVQLVLLGALDVSVWQKLNAELPWLTEPAEDPPPRLFLMHGQLAAYGYFVLQSLGLLLAASLRVPVAAIAPFASAIAAAIIAGLTFWLLSRKNVRVLPPAAAPPGRSAAFAAIGTAAACAIGIGWFQALQWMPFSADILERSRAALPPPEDVAMWIGLIVLAVIVAPLSEEFIFRGLVYQGLRRTHGIAWSVMWSSLFFTAVHPPASSVAVFGVAVVNALIVERTGRLTPCIAIHAAYNAFVLWLQFRV
jgi:ABC-2 type transport system permease protein